MRHRYTSGKLRQLVPMTELRLPTQGKVSKPGWSVSRQWWGLNTTIGWLFKRPGPPDATNLKRQKLPIQRPSARMQLHSHSTSWHFIQNMQSTWASWKNRLWRQRLKSWQDFLSAHFSCPVPCSNVPQSGPTFLLQYLIRELVIITPIHSLCQGVPGTGVTTCNYFPQVRTHTVPTAQKGGNPLPDLLRDMFIDEDSPKGLQEDLPCSKREKASNWFSSLKPSRADAFCQDSGPIREARECYFTTHLWDWVQSNTDNLSDIFRELAQSTGLLDKSIFKLQWSWDGLDHLKHGNYILRSLSKGLKFLRMVSTKESPKIMGLKGIHDPDALRHFTGYTYWLWCGKDGQNEGIIINHLRTVHYKLGLICDQCFGCPAVTSDSPLPTWLQQLYQLSQCHLLVPLFSKKALTAILSNQSWQLMNCFTRTFLIITRGIFLKNKQTNEQR